MKKKKNCELKDGGVEKSRQPVPDKYARVQPGRGGGGVLCGHWVEIAEEHESKRGDGKNRGNQSPKTGPEGTARAPRREDEPVEEEQKNVRSQQIKPKR